MTVGNQWLKATNSKVIKSISTRVIAWLAFLATLVAIVGGMTMLDNRYARAADVQKTQAQFLQSVQLININLELMNLKNRKLELKSDRRNLTIEAVKAPENTTLKLMIEETNEDLTKVNYKIGELENRVVTD